MGFAFGEVHTARNGHGVTVVVAANSSAPITATVAAIEPAVAAIEPAVAAIESAVAAIEPTVAAMEAAVASIEAISVNAAAAVVGCGQCRSESDTNEDLKWGEVGNFIGSREGVALG